jgi:hypothetical protein
VRLLHPVVQPGRRADRRVLDRGEFPHPRLRRPVTREAVGDDLVRLRPGAASRFRSSAAKCGPNLITHVRIVSYVTAMPRSYSSSSTSRRLSARRRALPGVRRGGGRRGRDPVIGAGGPDHSRHAAVASLPARPDLPRRGRASRRGRPRRRSRRRSTAS